jgi:hypothetical protein
MYEYTYHIIEIIFLVFYDKPTLGHVWEFRLLLSIAMTGWCDKKNHFNFVIIEELVVYKRK